ncbi:MAG: hypothetical protein Q3984_03610 [Eubacteriales bacterium]|nr:hypothetical protein [Eubacteriales bacterium]
MIDCINHGCGGKQAGVCLNDLPGVKCYGYEPPHETNADKIRQMSDEELAEWLADIADHGGGRCAPGCYDCTKKTCKEGWLDWLKEEVDG